MVIDERHREASMNETYVVQGFTRRKAGLTMDSPMQARNVEHAKRMAERLAKHKALVVAFMRSGDPKTGDYEDAKLIVAHGDVPDEVAEMPRM